jgi:hypothetical protein
MVAQVDIPPRRAMGSTMREALNEGVRPELQADQAVRVTVPMEVMYDLKKLQKVQQSVLDRLGCSSCHSGFDIRFIHHRDFVVDQKLNVQEQVINVGIAGR